MNKGSATTTDEALVLVLQFAQHSYKENAIYDGCGENFIGSRVRETS